MQDLKIWTRSEGLRILGMLCQHQILYGEVHGNTPDSGRAIAEAIERKSSGKHSISASTVCTILRNSNAREGDPTGVHECNPSKLHSLALGLEHPYPEQLDPPIDGDSLVRMCCGGNAWPETWPSPEDMAETLQSAIASLKDQVDLLPNEAKEEGESVQKRRGRKRLPPQEGFVDLGAIQAS